MADKMMVLKVNYFSVSLTHAVVIAITCLFLKGPGGEGIRLLTEGQWEMNGPGNSINHGKNGE